MRRPLPPAAAALALGLAAPAVPAQDLSSDAFREQDYYTALSLWLGEAEDGSAEAKMGLGTLYDLGLGVARDSATAFRWYLEAAEEGLADAQFNVAVMLDAGTGVPQDRAAAALWYARAAAAGNVRAQYNLGILYELGDGVARNPALARAWLAAAAPSLGAARDRLDRLAAAEPAPLAPPRPVSGVLSEIAAVPAEEGTADGTPPEGPGGPHADLVWTAAPGPADARFVVELAARRAAGGFEPVAAAETALSAVSLPAPADRPLLWRVSMVGAGDYAASDWQPVARPAGSGPAGDGDAGDGGTGTADTDAPLGRVRFELPADDTAALMLAAELSAGFRVAGLLIEAARLDAAPGGASVTYAFAADRPLAERIATALPGFGPDAARQAPLPEALPGLVTVAVVGGPAAQ